MPPTESSRDPLREFTERGLALIEQAAGLSGVNTRDIATLMAYHEAEKSCRLERMGVEKDLGERIGKLEVTISGLKGNLTAWAALGAVVGGAAVQAVFKFLTN